MRELTGFDELNEAEYLYLHRLSEPRDNSLLILVREAKVAGKTASAPERSGPVTGFGPIKSTEDCRTFELYWENYVAYLVTEEFVGSCAAGGYDDEEFAGGVLRLYSKSHFLDHIARNTGEHSGPVLHYKLICLNHLIDVASSSGAEIRSVTNQKTN